MAPVVGTTLDRDFLADDDDDVHVEISDTAKTPDCANGGQKAVTESLSQPERPVATPCRVPEAEKPVVELDQTPSPPVSPTVLEADSPGSTVPSVDDSAAAKPNPKVLRLSEAATDARLRRVFEPSKRTGQYKVSDAILAQYKKNGKSRKSIQKLFETCGYDKEKGSQNYDNAMFSFEAICADLDVQYWNQKIPGYVSARPAIFWLQQIALKRKIRTFHFEMHLV